MASLLDRMNISKPDSGAGPIRSKSANSNRASPYNRESRAPSKGDVNSTWSHDLFDGNKSLSERLSSGSSGARKVDAGQAQKALRSAVGADNISSGGFNIKGASSIKDGNVVQISGLVKGTTPADVEAIFKRCGAITSSKLHSSPTSENVVIRIVFKAAASATTAVQKFNGQQADGRTLSVTIVGGAAVSLGGRLGLGVDGVSDSVDALMDGGGDAGGSKMRSDEILASDPRARAQVLLAPPGADPKDYVQQPTGPRRGGGRGRGNRRGGGGRGGRKAGMDID
ncbi:hypothetical protein HWV62_29469 [Athelia sp. TMB]|nr:hypothetical protein HWV62_36501 [Athelia sp. TMB]KAF7982246.1 hypothetical protein HWV62_29469 [Athelia sp. TMB]